jgi:hypothetical protein
MAAHALQHTPTDGQLALYGRTAVPPRPAQSRRVVRRPVCEGCRSREARYGFQDHDQDPLLERPHALCFQCFRMELDRRRLVAAQRARGWNATQVNLPLADTLAEIRRRRGRAQIAARHALGLS